ncbi:hypothetical protein JW930_06240 [Candidatus Woesearchaeota archaeon]|nr:hypothetical protein [Candidatus Woesearchaeota archaeon]
MKSQISSQVFIYIFAAIIISITLLVGFKVIDSLRRTAYQKSINDFKMSLASLIETRAFEYGSVEKVKLNLPSEFSEVCFVNSDFIVATGEIENYPLIKDSVDSGTRENIFLITNTIADSFFIDTLEVGDGFLCIKNNNGIKVRVEGIGNKARLSDDS